ncbi:hypothetical protein HDU98_009774 [Podochytrium sp. JEL0797]|nr:hypothetical protein HDU98_009774 [Podochytrium sp. JEL0797]
MHKVIVALFSVLLTAFLLLTVGFLVFSANPEAKKTLTKIAGAVMILDACIAWYAAAAILVTKETSYFELSMYKFESEPMMHKDLESHVEGGDVEGGFKRSN